MDFLFIRGTLLVLCSVFNLVLAFFLFSESKKNKPALHLGLAALFSALYCAACAGMDFSWLFSSSYQTKLFWARMTWTGALIIPAYLCFVFSFTGRKKWIYVKSGAWYLGAFLILGLAFGSPFIVKSLDVSASVPTGMCGKLDPAARIYLVSGILVGLFCLLENYFKSRGFRRMRLKYFLLGIVVYSIGGIFFTGLLPLRGRTGSTAIPALLSSAWVGFTAYAIVRYRLMDIRVLLGRAFVFIASFVTAVSVFSLLFFLRYGAGFEVSSASFILFSFIVFLFLLKIKDFYQGMAETSFYPGLSQKRVLLENLEHELSYLLEMDTLSSLLAESLDKVFDLKGLAFFTKIPGKEKFELQHQFGFEKEGLKELLEDRHFLSFLKKRKAAFIPQEFSLTEAKKRGIEVVIPLFFEGSLIGVVLMGPEESKNAYSREELKVLERFGKKVQIALRNTLIHGEAKKRKKDLESFYNLGVDTQMRIVQLKKKVEKLEKELEKEKKEKK